MSALLDKQFRFSKLLLQLLQHIQELGYDVQVGDFWRGTDKLKIPGHDEQYTYQELLFFNGRSKVTHSEHNDRAAGDIMLWKNGQQTAIEEYRQFGEYWESLGGRWGGRFGVAESDYSTKIGWDPYHFET